MQEHQQRLAELESHIDLTRTSAEKMNDEAVRESRRLLEDAEKQAATIVSEARAQAARVRADSDRELAAATQRRDSINAQLSNVRQMLATLTGGAMVPMIDPFDGEPADASAEADADPVDEVTDEVVAADAEDPIEAEDEDKS
jgi:hypothetical protein